MANTIPPGKAEIFRTLQIIIAFLFSFQLSAQDINFDWVHGFGGEGIDNGQSLTTDAAGNIYVTGSFNDSIDFDPSGSTAWLSATGQDVFLAKYDASGNYLWAINIGGSSSANGRSVALDGSGNVYITGRFYGTADFDPSAAVANLTATGVYDVFLAKYSTSGNYLWAIHTGGLSSDIGTDNDGNVYITGIFSATTDFDPSPAVANLSPSGVDDTFLAKYDESGNYLWAKRMGGDFNTRPSSLAIDNTGNIYITGHYFGTSDFNPGGGVANLSTTGSYDIFLAKYNPSGSYLWAKSMGGASVDNSNSIAIDGNGDVYITGDFGDTADFDPSADTAYLNSAGSNDVFLARYSSSGNYLWSKSMGGPNFDQGVDVAIDAVGNPYLTGVFYGTADLDPSAAHVNFSSKGNSDIFFARYDTAGNYVWAKAIGSTGSDMGNSLDVDLDGNIYITGDFWSTVDFDPSCPVTKLTAVSYDIFLAKYVPGPVVNCDDLLIVSDTSWRRSSIVTTATANQYPWNGVSSNLPAAATFTIPVEIGQPHAWHSIDSVEGAEVIKSGSGITYFRKTFNLNENTGIVARFRSYMDDGVEIYINGFLLAREDDRDVANARGAWHDLQFLNNGTHENGYMGGDEFDFTANYLLDSLLYLGENEIIIVLRNKTGSDAGGFSFRMDLKSNEAIAPELTEYLVSNGNWKKSTYTTAATSLTFPWAGSPVLPADNTFILPVDTGQPYGYKSIVEVEGSHTIKAGENLTYYRATFDLVDSADINARFRATFDDGIEVYLNRNLLFRADDITTENFKLPAHDILYNANSTMVNAHAGGDMFEYVSNTVLDTLFCKGENSVIVAMRNRPNDKGGFSFRLDLDQNGNQVIEKKQTDNETDPPALEPMALDFAIYPNPTTGSVQIDFTRPVEKEGEILLLDLNGKLLMRQMFENSTSGIIDLNLSQYPKGIYILQLRCGTEYAGKRVMKL